MAVNPFRTWAFHNLFAHPASEIVWWLGALCPAAKRLSMWIHDATVPKGSRVEDE